MNATEKALKPWTCPSCGVLGLQKKPNPLVDLTEGYVIYDYKCPGCKKTGKINFAIDLTFLDHDVDD